MSPKQPTPYVFLSYAREDEATVGRIRRRLERARIRTWMDVENIRYGEEWDPAIDDAMRHAFRVLAFLSSTAVSKRGFIQREFRTALGIAAEMPDDNEWLIPVLLDDCRVPRFNIGGMTFSQLHLLRLFSGVDPVKHLIGSLRQVWPPTRLVTAHQMVIIHSSWRSKKHDRTYASGSGGRPVYRFDVKLGINPAALDAIESVTWLLPPAWPNSPIRINDRSESFGHKDLAWGDLVVRANVSLKTGGEPIHLAGFVRLQGKGPRLLTRSYDK